MWVKDLQDLKERIFIKYGIKPEISCLKCPYYDEIKGHEICMKSEDGEIHECKDAEKIYPKLTDRRILNLLVILSKYKSIEFQFERNIEDIALNILNELLQMDNKELRKEVRHAFKV